MRMLRMCPNWKVLAGLAVVGGGIYAVAQGLAAAALPILLLAICPLSMLFMMKAMQGDGREDVSQPPPAGADQTREAHLFRLRKEQANLAERIDALEQDETRGPGYGSPVTGARGRQPNPSRRG